MLFKLLDKMAPLEFDNSELDHAISINREGDIATVRDLIAEKCSDEIKVAFRAAFGDVIPALPKAPVIPVRAVDPAAYQRVAIALQQRANPNHIVSNMSGGSYTPQQLIHEIEHGTSMGETMIRASRLNGILTEEAIKIGKVRPRTTARSEVAPPAFDF